MSDPSCSRCFEEDILGHLSSAYNLARQLTRHEQDAEDIVQEAYLRAFRFYDRFQGGDARPWLLKIVRNVFYTWVRRKSLHQRIDLEQDVINSNPQFENPEEILVRRAHSVLLQKAIDELPAQCREVVVLREIEEMSYQEISAGVGAPAGTVMSRLSRARARLRQSMADLINAVPQTTTKN